MESSREEQIVFWHHIADGFNAGIKVGDILTSTARAMADTEFGPIATVIFNEVMKDGKSIAETMTGMQQFDQRVIDAVDIGERGGILDRVASLIVETLEADDLDKLSRELPSVDAIKYFTGLLEHALETRASDIHIDQTELGTSLVRLRVDGVLQQVDSPCDGLMPAVVNYIKMMSSMNVADRHLPQDGRVIMDLDRGKCRTTLRVSVVPAFYGERVVIRLLLPAVARDLPTLQQFGLPDDDLAVVERLCHLPEGLIICTGPVGSGKTTLLYAMLMEANSPEVSVLTAENPVEISLAGIGQIQIRPEVGLTLPLAIRNILRQDPDVVMVGEICDLETLQLCAQVSLTGHLVMSSLHTNTCIESVKRLIDMGLEAYLISSCLAGIIAQRLVRKLCPDCRELVSHDIYALPEEARELISSWQGAQFYKAVGCEHCNGHGYKGRVAVNEVLVMNDRLHQLVVDGGDSAAMLIAAKASGMKTLMHAALLKAAQGITTIPEAMRITPIGTGV